MCYIKYTISFLFFYPFKIQKRKVSPFSRRFDYYSFKPPLLNIYTSPACFGSLKFLHTHRTRPLKKENGKKKLKEFLTKYYQLTVPDIFNQHNIKNLLASNRYKLIQKQKIYLPYSNIKLLRRV